MTTSGAAEIAAGAHDPDAGDGAGDLRPVHQVVA